MEISDRKVVALGRRGIVGSPLVTIVLLSAVSAGTWWTADMVRTAASRRSMASYHAVEVRSAEKLLAKLDASAYFGIDALELREKTRDWLNQRISFHKEREQRYLDAAVKPWSKEPEYKTPPPPIPVHLLSQAAD